MIRRDDEYELFAKELCKIILNRNDLVLFDRPDVIAPDNSVGIEVTRAVAQEMAKLDDAYFDKRDDVYDVLVPDGYELSDDKFRCLRPSRSFDEQYENEKMELIKTCVKKKIKKATKYAETTKMGLFIYTDSPTAFNDKEKRKKLFKDIFDSQEKVCKELGVDLKFDFEFIIFFLEDFTQYIVVSKDKILEKELTKEIQKQINENVYKEIEEAKENEYGQT